MITLRLMNADEYKEYVAVAINTYAKEKVLAGNWKEEESIAKAKESYEQLLPEGEKTENHYLYTIMNDDQACGMIWLGKQTDEQGFIYDFSIEDKYRGNGFGKEAMKLVEQEGKKVGLKKIGLHVFGHNHAARALYEKLGYQITNVQMIKEI
ncbi:MAG: GNAT family N-acetyltransferase [Bacillaceae bacterium]